MSHQEKQEIFDRHAQSHEFETFGEYLEEFGIHGIVKKDLMNFVFAACDLVQEEQQKRIADRAELKEILCHIGTEYEVDKSSIINPENIIK
ncbi:hypothetical protein [Chryseobacterium sp.]|uniref:hypothetical protein n=1 Tax=Chryseobacterium sp. TaxID=1871047 RepID=UPI0024E1C8E2|nr:hypothetical protein [Chryseobacterium sp.]